MSGVIPERVEILVVGAGPVGLSLACALHRQGVGCLLIDADEGPTPRNESRALGIQARTMEVFRAFGLAGRIQDEGRPMHGLGLFRAGRPLGRIRFELDGDVAAEFRHPIILSQARTERLLLECLQAMGGAAAWGRKLESFTQDAEGVSARVVDLDGTPREVRASWMIGCDGARSAVRRGLNLAFEGGEYEERFLLADLHVGWSMPDDQAVIALTPGGPMVCFPLPEPGRWRLVDTTGLVDAQTPEAIADRFRSLVNEHVAPGTVVDEPSWTSSFRLHRRVVDRYRVGRCFVAGDAAHLHSPAGGQGMNTGIQDAFNLAWKLALAVQGRAAEGLLDSYQAERRPVAVGVLRGTDVMTRVVTLRNPLARTVRNRLFAIAGGLSAVRHRVSLQLSELAVNYRQSPIVAGDDPGWLEAIGRGGLAGLRRERAFAGGPRAGDRAPDVPLRSEIQPGDPAWSRLSDALSEPCHHLLVFEGLEPTDGPVPDGRAIEALVEASRGRDWLVPWRVRNARTADDGAAAARILLDPDGVLHRAYGALAPCLYVIRPDGYIGYRSPRCDGRGLRDYRKRIFTTHQQADDPL
jgi:2-polyprenyl-6-methoxyphenol hydroxylase-like FAD-dependent oxidoreductase